MNFHGLRALTRVFFLELIREKLVWGAAALGFGLFLMGLALGNLSFDEKERIYFHLSVTAIHSVGLFLMLILGATKLNREIEKQTCLLVLSRPISRQLFYMAQFLSLAIFIFIFDGLLFVTLGLSLSSSFSPSNWSILFLGIFFEQSLVLSLAMFASQKLRSFIAGFFAFGIFLVGHWLPDLQYFAKKSENEPFQVMVRIFDAIVPHFHQLNFRSFEALKEGLPGSNLGFVVIHGLGWTLLLCVLGSQLWKRRDLV